MPKTKPLEESYAVYTAANGSVIAVQETGVESGKSTKVLYPAIVVISKKQTSFEFTPLLFVEKEFELFFSGVILGRSAMPKMMIPFYEEFINKPQS